MNRDVPFPVDFAFRMQQQLGTTWPEFVEAHHQSSPVSIRINPRKGKAFHDAPPVPWAVSGRSLETRPVFTLDPLFHAGSYYVQEASSMFLEQALRALDISSRWNVLDLCAAPGGKSTHLLSLLPEDSLLVSNEVIRSRASVLAENITKWGRLNAVVTNNDAKDFQSLAGFFDLIVMDAPCSGEGLFRKDPNAMQEWSIENAALCSARQKRILADIWPALKEGGVLIYCTCTYNPEENEANLEWLTRIHDVEFISVAAMPEWNINEVRSGKAVGYQLLPHRVNGEGFFISVVRKKSPERSFRQNAKKNLVSAPKKNTETIRSWFRNDLRANFFLHQDLLYALPAEKISEVAWLYQHVHVIRSGIPIATVKHDKLVPEHALAMSVDIDTDHHPKIAVSAEQALQYLRKETPTLPPSEKGYHLVMFEEVPLGWVNSIGNRYNNLYPQEWRIRMGG